jgi:drug/metabolite transporter (DMT)-like permease
MEEHKSSKSDGRLIAGIILLIVGGVLLIERGMYLDYSLWDIVALVAVAGGALAVVFARISSDYREGVWWILMGIWFYISINKIGGYGFGETWPVILIILGINELWKSTERRGRYIPSREKNNEY